VACCCFRISFFSFFPPTNPVFFWLISKDEFACLIVVCYYLSTAVGSLSSSHESRYMRFRRSESALSSMGRGRIEIKRIENNTSRGRSPSASVATGFSRRLTSSQSSATLRWRSSSSPAGAASTSTQTTGAWLCIDRSLSLHLGSLVAVYALYNLTLTLLGFPLT